MLRRSMSVVFKPLRNNHVLLPESYFRLMAPYINGCLNLTYNFQDVVHVTWASFPGTNLQSTELGMDASTAAALGIKEGAIVKCVLVTDVGRLQKVSVSPLSQKDWEMVEMSSSRVQNTMLDQTRVVTKGQKMVVWLNKSITLTLKIDSMTPSISFGMLTNNTELIVAPFPGGPSKSASGASYSNGNGPRKSSSTASSTRPYSVLTPSSSIDSSSDLSTSTSSSTVNVLGNGSNGNLSRSTTCSSMKSYQDKGESKLEALDQLRKMIVKEASPVYEFRAVFGEWRAGDSLCDVHVRHIRRFDFDRVYVMKVANNTEYMVNIRPLPREDNGTFPENIYPAIEINRELAKYLGIREYEKVTLKPKTTVLNFIDRLDVHPTASEEASLKQMRNMEQSFKRFIIDQSKFVPVLLNQDQLIRLPDNTTVMVKLQPESFKYVLIDGDILTEAKVKMNDLVQSTAKYYAEATAGEGGGGSANDPPAELAIPQNYVPLDKYEEQIAEIVDQIKFNLCLDPRNKSYAQGNHLIVGAGNAGKSVFCNRILEELGKHPFCAFVEVFSCSRAKGRKPESLMKDLRLFFVSCMAHSPSILVLENLDVLTRNTAENTHDAEYYNKVSEVMKSLIKEFTKENAVTVIATVSNLANLNKRVYHSRGEHLFQYVFKLPELELSDRETVLKKLSHQMSCSKKINWTKLGTLTEGYTVGDLVQLAEKGIFCAFRENPKFPTMTESILMEALRITNSYCLQGVQNNALEQDQEEEEATDDLPGLEGAVEVMEEVIMWPTKYLSIFQDSPLRNQAGILLYGPPGTGKTYLVSQLVRAWNLRMISVKGPELLAKYIGQSEENVRALFEKARNTRPCVLFFDEFDSLAPRRGHDSTGVTDRVVNQLLTELDGVESLQGVTVIGATSRPELLDPALLRSGRIDRFVECWLPNAGARLSIFQNMCSSLQLAPDVDLKTFASRSDQFTGADIKSVIVSANMAAVKELLDQNPEEIPETVAIEQRHFTEAFESTRPSLSAQDIQKYRRQYSSFTNKEKPSRDFVAKKATLA